MEQPVLVLIGPVVSAVFVFLGVRVTARSNEKAKEIEARGPEWKAFADSLQSRMDAQGDEISNLKDQVEGLQKTVDQLKHKYWQAVEGIRRAEAAMPGALNAAKLSPEVFDDVQNA